MNILDTRDLLEERDTLKNEIEEKYNEDEEDQLYYSEISEKYIQDMFEDEYEIIEEIDRIEDEVGDEFYHGVTLIDEDDFVEYVEELVEDCGYLPQNLPHWIVIDWESTADNVSSDYITVDYKGKTYYARS